MILHRSSSASQPLGPFPPLPLAQIPPLFPPTPSVPQPKKPGPDSVQHTSCKSPIDINQAKVCVYDNSSFLSCTALNTQISSSCNCTSETVCDHSLQILHISSSSDKPPVWSIAKVASFTSIFSTLSLQGHLAIMDGQANLYVPILAGAIDYLDSEYISSELRSASVKTIANVLATVVAHPRSNLSSLILEPCSASLCDLRFKDVVNIVDFARRQMSFFSSCEQSLRLEVRAVTPSKTKMSFCKIHPRAPRVCTQCLFQSSSDSDSTCPHCYKQYFPFPSQSAQPPCPTPAFEETDSFAQIPQSPPSYANSVKNGKNGIPTNPPPPTPPPQVITKITNIEKQLQSQADNFRHVLDQLHSLSQTQNTHSDRLLTIEDSSTWKDSKHKSCQSTKRVDSNTASLKKLSLEVATLSGQVNEISIDVRSPPIESVKLATQVADLTRQLSDMHNVMSAQIGDLTKQVTDIQATLYKRLTNPNTTVTLTPIVDTLPATSNTPPPSTPTDPFADEDVLNI